MDNSLLDLSPKFLPFVKEFLSTVNDSIKPFTCKIIITYRNGADQNAAKSCGLSNASAGQSPHNCIDASGNPASQAADFAIFDSNGAYVTDGTDRRYTTAGNIAETLGLVWGGSWSHGIHSDGTPYDYRDYDHIEASNWKASIAS